MQSYLKDNDYYDRKAKAAPLNEKDFCFILQPKADNQGSKILFRDYRWTVPYIIEKALPNDNYIVRRLNTNKTQILHRIRLKKFVPNTPLEDKYNKEKFQADEDIVIPQDDLYTISWEADFDYETFEPRKDVCPNENTSRVAGNYVSEENEQSTPNEYEIRPRMATSCDGLIPADEPPSSGTG